MPADPARARDLFLHAVGTLPATEWDAYAAAACGADTDLAGRVAELLRVHREAGSFLARPAVGATGAFDPAAAEPTAAGPAPAAGALIGGRYKLLERAGEGGMGEVWVAEQTEPVRRKVAVKLIKAGLDSRQVAARFEAERQALALMDHPNIAKVLDGGVTDLGRPFFVMELVKGAPITKYCDEHRLPVRDRLALFADVCRAVQHAHQKGVIHRDLKPSNVLVAPYDGRPVVKVIDFGVAKAAGVPLTDKTLFTGLGAVVGTPEYMSPEQAELNNQDIDTRSDVYALGVLLYELLTGTTPLTKRRVKEAALLEVLRVIREDEPPRPSTRLSTDKGLPSIAACRSLDPRQLSGLVRGELDWIVMKSLEKDRGRRYETANGFAQDIERYLADEPVLACPPSAGYRFRKFARRNRLRLALIGGAGLALVVAAGGIAVAIGWAVRDRAAVAHQVALDAATRRAKLEGKIAEDLDEVRARYEGDDLPGALAAVRRAEERAAGGAEAGDEVRQRVSEWRADLDVIEQLDEIYFDHTYIGPPEGDAAYARIFRGIGIDAERLPVEEAGAQIRSRLTGRRLAELLDQWADLLLDLTPQPGDRRRRLIRVARAADPDPLRTRVRLISENWDGPAAERLAASADADRLSFQGLRQLTTVLYWTGGEAGRKTVLRLLEGALARHPGDFRLARSLANRYLRLDSPKWPEVAHYLSIALAVRPQNVSVQVSLAHANEVLGKLDQADAGFRRATRIKSTDAIAHLAHGSALSREFRLLDEAIAEYREAVRLKPDWADAHNYLGAALSAKAQPDEALAHFREAIRLDPKNALAHANVGAELLNRGREDDGIAEYRAAIALNPGDPEIRFRLAVCLNSLGRRGAAIAEYREVVRLDPKHPHAPAVLATLLRDEARFEEAIAVYRAVIRVKPDNADAYAALAFVLADCPDAKLRDPTQAVKLATKALELEPGGNRFGLGLAHYRGGNWHAAVQALEKSADPAQVGHSYGWFFLAMAHWQLGEKDEARKWYDRAVQWMEKNQVREEVLVRFRAEAETLLELKK